MKNSILKASLFMMISACTLISCSKDDDDNKSSDSRNVRYEITGNATGNFDATFITGSGAASNETPTTIPWSKEVVMQNGNNSVSFSAGVGGATPGKTITTKIYVGGVEKKSETATVQPNGIAVIASLSYTLK